MIVGIREMIAEVFADAELRASSDAVDSCACHDAARQRRSVGPMIGKDLADGWKHAGGQKHGSR
jgi:hypothetical protein